MMQYQTLACLLICLPAAIALGEPGPRVDISATTGRSDAETVGWTEWEIGGGQSASIVADGVKITLRGDGAPLEGFLYKPGLAKNATLASDGVRCEGGAIEIVLENLSAGRHSIATFHSKLGNQSVTPQTITVGDQSESVTPESGSPYETYTASAFVEFVVESDRPVALRLTGKDDTAILNGLQLDRPNPSRTAAAPQPANFDDHVSSLSDSGKLKLAWHKADGVEKHRVYLARGATREDAIRRAADATPESDALVGAVEAAECTVNLDPNDSLAFHAWRVDSVHPDGEVSTGEVWSFRVATLAFPGAEGYGRFARGGRGGRVIKVTNLNDSGPGSFRAAIEATGPRTVVFDVSGRIDLKDRLGIRDGQITLAGQTAPGKGVCISNYNLGALGARDVIIRYLRVRPGDTAGKTLDGMGLASCDHAIVDHCSISWTQDEAFSSRGAKNITLQRTLISEALNIAGHKKYGEGTAHGYAASIGGDIGSFHHNLLAHCAGRNWSLAGGIDQANRHRGQLDIRNNVVYNWDYRTTDGGARLVQFVANYYKPGPASRIKTYLNPQYENPSFGPQQYYVEGNVMEGVSGPEGPEQPLEGVRVRGSQPWQVTFDEPFYESYVSTQSAEAAYDNVLADVGCNYPQLDEHDKRVIQETRQGETTYTGSVSGKPGLPDSQTDVGGWEDYPEEHRPDGWDTDNDGMPNVWETSRGLNPNDPADGAVDPDGDGFTNLEDYLNGLVE